VFCVNIKWTHSCWTRATYNRHCGGFPLQHDSRWHNVSILAAGYLSEFVVYDRHFHKTVNRSRRGACNFELDWCTEAPSQKCDPVLLDWSSFTWMARIFTILFSSSSVKASKCFTLSDLPWTKAKTRSDKPFFSRNTASSVIWKSSCSNQWYLWNYLCSWCAYRLPFLANVNPRSCSLYAVINSSVCLSSVVCRL